MCKIASINTGGLSAHTRLHGIIEHVKMLDIDITLLQETNFTQDTYTQLERYAYLHTGYAMFATPAPRRGSGVAILVSNKFTLSSPVYTDINPGFASSLDFVVQDKHFKVVNVYLPHDQDITRQVLDSVQSCLVNFSGEIILGGDFNCTLNPSMDRHSGVEFNSVNAARLRNFVSSFRLVDIYRWMHPTTRSYTRVSRNIHGNLAGSRIDRLYVSSDILAHFVGVTHEVCSVSDHLLVVATSTIVERRTAYWIFNNHLLNSEQFIQEFIVFWHDWQERKQDFPHLSQWWDVGKLQIRSFIEANFNRSRYQASSLSAEVSRVAALLPTQPELILYYNTIKERLAAQDYKHSLEFVLRSQSRWLREGDSPTEYFFQATRRRTASCEVESIVDESGQVLNGQQLSEYIRAYYGSLYSESTSTTSSTTDEFLEHIQTFSDESRDVLDTVITLEDMIIATKDLRRHTSPGYDGLTPEFFIRFRNLLIPDLLEVFNSAVETHTDFPSSWRRSVMRLIPKKGDLQRMGNWRPVTLCNVDYKIVCKALGAILSSVIASVIHPEQSYCVPGRSIYDNIAVAKHLFDYHEKTGAQMAMISLDQQKAFDSVSHEYLLTVLEAFGFPPRWLDIVGKLYRDSAILIKHRGQVLAPISFHRGIRQGCPLSGMLYDLSLEPLLVNLRRRLQEYSVRLPYSNVSPLMLAYADDLSIFVTRDEAFPVARAVFEQYERIAGAKINLNKSQGLWCGRWRDRTDTPLNIQWTNTCLKYLGVYIGRESKTNNSRMALEKLSKAVNSWRSRLFPLSLMGRTVVINYLITSSIIHLLKSETFEDGFVGLLQAKAIDAFWCGRRWVAESTLCLPVKEGGLGLTNLVVKSRCLQVRAFQRVFCQRDTLISQLWVNALGGIGIGEHYYLLSVRPPFPRDWPQDLISTIQTWGRIRPAFHLKWNALGYTQFASIPIRFNPEITDSVFSNARGLDADIHPLTVLGDIIDVAGNCQIQTNTLQLHDLAASARERFRQLGTSDPGTELVDAFVLNRPPNTPFSTLTTRLLRDVLMSIRPPELTGYNRWRTYLGVDMGVIGGITSRVVYSYPSNYKDADVAFKLLHHSLMHPNQLSHIDPRVRRICTVCAGEGTLFHRFFACPALQNLMNLVRDMCQLIHADFDIAWTSFLVGPRRCSQVNCLISFVLTLAKSTIHFYYMRIEDGNQNTDPQHHAQALKSHFVDRLKRRLRLEYLATNANTFNCTWQPLSSVQNGALVFHW